jgi:hypothetical protein
MNRDPEPFRMFHWLLLSVVLYAAAILLKDVAALPQVQIVCWKLGHINAAAFMGYWIDRTTFRDRLHAMSEPLRQIRRAIIMAACILAVALGM